MRKLILLFLFSLPAFAQSTGNAGMINLVQQTSAAMYNGTIVDNIGIGSPKDTGTPSPKTIDNMMLFDDPTGTMCVQGNVWSLSDMSALINFTPNTSSPGCPLITTSNFTVSTQSQVGYVNFNGGNRGDYRLCRAPNNPSPLCSAASPYINAGTDGKDIGADVDLVNTLTAGVE